MTLTRPTTIDELKDMVVQIFHKEGYPLQHENVKCWISQPSIQDITNGFNHIKGLGLPLVLVYTTQIPLKDRIGDELGVKIYDSSDLEHLSIKHLGLSGCVMDHSWSMLARNVKRS